jgi:hypothetical protein
MVVKRWFTLYFIPIFPMFRAGEYLECAVCAGTFGPEALHYQPARNQAELIEHFKRFLVLAAAEGPVSPARSQAALQQFSTATGQPMTLAELESLQQMARQAGTNLLVYARQIAPQFDHDFRNATFHACRQVLLADGRTAAAMQPQLAALEEALGVAPTRLA